MEAKKNNIRNNLKTEGIINKNKLLPTPHDFTNVVVISPGNAAGLGDFKSSTKVLEQYKLCQFTYLEATFQSKQAPESIIKALQHALICSPKADAVVLIRGGGATADLHWLNDEGLARCVCTYAIPVFTGIGHERDNTIIDEVANHSFDTPSKVIEYIKSSIYNQANNADDNWVFICNQIHKKSSKHQLELAQYYKDLCLNINNSIKDREKSLNQLLSDTRSQIQRGIDIAISNADHFIKTITHNTKSAANNSCQKIISLHEEISNIIKILLNNSENKITAYFNDTYSSTQSKISRSETSIKSNIEDIRSHATHRTIAAKNIISTNTNEIYTSIKRLALQSKRNTTEYYKNITDQASAKIKEAESRSTSLIDIINSYSPEKVLQRGYAFVKMGNDYIKSAKSVSMGNELDIIFHDGSLKTFVSNNQETKND